MSFEQPNFDIEPSPQEQEPIKSERKIEWEQKLAEVNEIADRLGKGVDEKIKEPVVAFLIHEFTPSSSCEGHITEEGEKEHGSPYPWIEVYAPEPEEWKENEEKKHECIINNLEQQRKMMLFLEEFYEERKSPFDARLTFDRIGAFWGFRVQSFGARMWPLLPLGERKQKLELYGKEMDDFTEFLKDKHFSKE